MRERAVLRYVTSQLNTEASRIGVKDPQYLIRSLAHYLVYGNFPHGTFIQNILDNKLRETVFGADDVNIGQLLEILQWLSMSLPAVAWDRQEWARKSGDERIRILITYFRGDLRWDGLDAT